MAKNDVISEQKMPASFTWRKNMQQHLVESNLSVDSTSGNTKFSRLRLERGKHKLHDKTRGKCNVTMVYHDQPGPKW
jgi:hypothetical protein